MDGIRLLSLFVGSREDHRPPVVVLGSVSSINIAPLIALCGSILIATLQTFESGEHRLSNDPPFPRY